uniref:Uncharacterized protein n=1 Tax=Chromera velia CCMP2878 TaxID=1169474 RepID=A0A0G4FLH9_9ALVE|eukprot:Cvel_3448.t1-p1 / transcript=Cvel_3448.t1 / gene=Cvel_3448 / organism=Chromera_velia_CCMP2878 / gene_product=hypothetical protein / transcript_product=hypothetical protein / location=Cvel_scaffold139:121-12929(+) / protein_length=2714 / sequence_SO=supercontig / SO=protein_coding / is_pseudo=false
MQVDMLGRIHEKIRSARRKGGENDNGRKPPPHAQGESNSSRNSAANWDPNLLKEADIAFSFNVEAQGMGAYFEEGRPFPEEVVAEDEQTKGKNQDYQQLPPVKPTSSSSLSGKSEDDEEEDRGIFRSRNPVKLFSEICSRLPPQGDGRGSGKERNEDSVSRGGAQLQPGRGASFSFSSSQPAGGSGRPPLNPAGRGREMFRQGTGDRAGVRTPGPTVMPGSLKNSSSSSSAPATPPGPLMVLSPCDGGCALQFARPAKRQKEEDEESEDAEAWRFQLPEWTLTATADGWLSGRSAGKEGRTGGGLSHSNSSKGRTDSTHTQRPSGLTDESCMGGSVLLIRTNTHILQAGKQVLGRMGLLKVWRELHPLWRLAERFDSWRTSLTDAQRRWRRIRDFVLHLREMRTGSVSLEEGLRRRTACRNYVCSFKKLYNVPDSPCVWRRGLQPATERDWHILRQTQTAFHGGRIAAWRAMAHTELRVERLLNASSILSHRESLDPARHGRAADLPGHYSPLSQEVEPGSRAAMPDALLDVFFSSRSPLRWTHEVEPQGEPSANVGHGGALKRPFDSKMGKRSKGKRQEIIVEVRAKVQCRFRLDNMHGQAGGIAELSQFPMTLARPPVSVLFRHEGLLQAGPVSNAGVFPRAFPLLDVWGDIAASVCVGGEPHTRFDAGDLSSRAQVYMGDRAHLHLFPALPLASLLLTLAGASACCDGPTDPHIEFDFINPEVPTHKLQAEMGNGALGWIGRTSVGGGFSAVRPDACAGLFRAPLHCLSAFLGSNGGRLAAFDCRVEVPKIVLVGSPTRVHQCPPDPNLALPLPFFTHRHWPALLKNQEDDGRGVRMLDGWGWPCRLLKSPGRGRALCSAMANSTAAGAVGGGFDGTGGMHGFFRNPVPPVGEGSETLAEFPGGFMEVALTKSEVTLLRVEGVEDLLALMKAFNLQPPMAAGIQMHSLPAEEVKRSISHEVIPWASVLCILPLLLLMALAESPLISQMHKESAGLRTDKFETEIASSLNSLLRSGARAAAARYRALIYTRQCLAARMWLKVQMMTVPQISIPLSLSSPPPPGPPVFSIPLVAARLFSKNQPPQGGVKAVPMGPSGVMGGGSRANPLVRPVGDERSSPRTPRSTAAAAAAAAELERQEESVAIDAVLNSDSERPGGKDFLHSTSGRGEGRERKDAQQSVGGPSSSRRRFQPEARAPKSPEDADFEIPSCGSPPMAAIAPVVPSRTATIPPCPPPLPPNRPSTVPVSLEPFRQEFLSRTSVSLFGFFDFWADIPLSISILAFICFARRLFNEVSEGYDDRGRGGERIRGAGVCVGAITRVVHKTIRSICNVGGEEDGTRDSFGAVVGGSVPLSLAAWAGLLPYFHAFWSVGGEGGFRDLTIRLGSKRMQIPVLSWVARGSRLFLQETHSDTMNFLLCMCADATAADGEGRTALHWAVLSGSEQLTATLLANCGPEKIGINRKDVYGRSALQYAVEVGEPGPICVLVEAGADPGCLLHPVRRQPSCSGPVGTGGEFSCLASKGGREPLEGREVEDAHTESFLVSLIRKWNLDGLRWVVRALEGSPSPSGSAGERSDTFCLREGASEVKHNVKETETLVAELLKSHHSHGKKESGSFVRFLMKALTDPHPDIGIMEAWVEDAASETELKRSMAFVTTASERGTRPWRRPRTLNVVLEERRHDAAMESLTREMKLDELLSSSGERKQSSALHRRLRARLGLSPLPPHSHVHDSGGAVWDLSEDLDLTHSVHEGSCEALRAAVGALTGVGLLSKESVRGLSRKYPSVVSKGDRQADQAGEERVNSVEVGTRPPVSLLVVSPCGRTAEDFLRFLYRETDAPIPPSLLCPPTGGNSVSQSEFIRSHPSVILPREVSEEGETTAHTEADSVQCEVIHLESKLSAIASVGPSAIRRFVIEDGERERGGSESMARKKRGILVIPFPFQVPLVSIREWLWSSGLSSILHDAVRGYQERDILPVVFVRVFPGDSVEESENWCPTVWRKKQFSHLKGPPPVHIDASHITFVPGETLIQSISPDAIRGRHPGSAARGLGAEGLWLSFNLAFGGGMPHISAECCLSGPSLPAPLCLLSRAAQRLLPVLGDMAERGMLLERRKLERVLEGLEGGETVETALEVLETHGLVCGLGGDEREREFEYLVPSLCPALPLEHPHLHVLDRPSSLLPSGHSHSIHLRVRVQRASSLSGIPLMACVMRAVVRRASTLSASDTPQSTVDAAAAAGLHDSGREGDDRPRGVEIEEAFFEPSGSSGSLSSFSAGGDAAFLLGFSSPSVPASVSGIGEDVAHSASAQTVLQSRRGTTATTAVPTGSPGDSSRDRGVNRIVGRDIDALNGLSAGGATTQSVVRSLAASFDSSPPPLPSREEGGEPGQFASRRLSYAFVARTDCQKVSLPGPTYPCRTVGTYIGLRNAKRSLSYRLQEVEGFRPVALEFHFTGPLAETLCFSAAEAAHSAGEVVGVDIWKVERGGLDGEGEGEESPESEGGCWVDASSAARRLRDPAAEFSEGFDDPLTRDAALASLASILRVGLLPQAFACSPAAPVEQLEILAARLGETSRAALVDVAEKWEKEMGEEDRGTGSGHKRATEANRKEAQTEGGEDGRQGCGCWPFGKRGGKQKEQTPRERLVRSENDGNREGRPSPRLAHSGANEKFFSHSNRKDTQPPPFPASRLALFGQEEKAAVRQAAQMLKNGGRYGDAPSQAQVN